MCCRSHLRAHGSRRLPPIRPRCDAHRQPKPRLRSRQLHKKMRAGRLWWMLQRSRRNRRYVTSDGSIAVGEALKCCLESWRENPRRYHRVDLVET